MLKGNSGIIAVLVIISVILSFASPVFLTTDNLLSVLRQVSNNMYLALGMTLVIILGESIFRWEPVSPCAEL